jgi:hypothetical protein
MLGRDRTGPLRRRDLDKDRLQHLTRGRAAWPQVPGPIDASFRFARTDPQQLHQQIHRRGPGVLAGDAPLDGLRHQLLNNELAAASIRVEFRQHRNEFRRRQRGQIGVKHGIDGSTKQRHRPDRTTALHNPNVRTGVRQFSAVLGSQPRNMSRTAHVPSTRALACVNSSSVRPPDARS